MKYLRLSSIVLLAATLMMLLPSCSSTPAPTQPATKPPTAASTQPAATSQTPVSTKPATQPQSPEPTQPVTLKVTQITVANNYNNVAFVAFEDEVTKATNGRVKFENYWMGSLVKAGEELDALKRNLVDVAGIWVNYYPSQLPLSNYEYAVIFSPTDPVTECKMVVQMRKDFPDLEKEQQKYNSKILMTFVVDSAELLTKKPLKTLEDLKGLKIAASGYWIPKAFEAVGAVPLDMPAAQRYTSLQTGLADGSVLGIPTADDRKLQELAKYCTLIGIGAQYGHWAISLDAWKGLSAKEQQAIQELATKWEIKGAETVQPTRDAVIAKWKNAGVTISEFPQAERVKWAEKIKGLPWQFAADNDKAGLPGTKLMETYFKVAKDAGYKFPVENVKP